MSFTKVKKSQLPKIRDELIERQNHRCPICGQWFDEYPLKDIVVDHDHTTGVIRGALCRNCNRAEGKIRTWCIQAKRTLTTLQWLVSLTKYLWTHREPQTEWLHPTFMTAEEKRLEKNKKQRLYYARKQAAKNVAKGVNA